MHERLCSHGLRCTLKGCLGGVSCTCLLALPTGSYSSLQNLQSHRVWPEAVETWSRCLKGGVSRESQEPLLSAAALQAILDVRRGLPLHGVQFQDSVVHSDSYLMVGTDEEVDSVVVIRIWLRRRLPLTFLHDENPTFYGQDCCQMYVVLRYTLQKLQWGGKFPQ